MLSGSVDITVDNISISPQNGDTFTYPTQFYIRFRQTESDFGWKNDFIFSRDEQNEYISNGGYSVELKLDDYTLEKFGLHQISVFLFLGEYKEDSTDSDANYNHAISQLYHCFDGQYSVHVIMPNTNDFVFSFDFNLKPSDEIVSFTKGFNILYIQSIKLDNAPETLTSKYKLAPPKDKSKEDKAILSVIDKVTKDNLKCKYRLLFELPSIPTVRSIEIDNGSLEVDQENYSFYINLLHDPLALFMSPFCNTVIVSYMAQNTPIQFTLRRYEYIDKSKSWEEVAASVGHIPVSLDSLNSPNSTQLDFTKPIDECESSNYPNTNFILQATLHKPLILPPPTPVHILKVDDVLPEIEKCIEDRPVNSIENFSNELYGVINEINELYLKVQSNDSSVDQNDIINSIKFNELQEKLKRLVVAITKEQYSSSDLSENQFLGSLNVLIMEILSKLLNNIYIESNINQLQNDSNIESKESTKIDDILFELHLNKDFNRTNELYIRQISIDPKNSSLWFKYGRFLLQKNNYSKALECIRQCIILGDDSDEILLYHSALLIQKEMYIPAKDILKDIYNRSNNNDSLLLLSIVYNSFETKLFFKDLFLYLMNIYNNNEYKIHFDTSKLLFDIGLYTLSWESFLRSSYETIENEEKHYLHGAEIAYLLKDYHTVESYCQKINKYSNPRAYHLLGMITLSTNLQSSIYNYKKSIELYGDENISLELMFHLAKAYFKNKEFVESKNLFLKICSIKNMAICWYYIGQISLQLNQLTEAEESFCEANILDNENSQVWGSLCYLSILNKRQSESYQLLEHALRNNINDIELLVNLCKSYYKLHDYHICEQISGTLISLGAFSQVYETVCHVYSSQKKIKELQSIRDNYINDQNYDKKVVDYIESKISIAN